MRKRIRELSIGVNDSDNCGPFVTVSCNLTDRLYSELKAQAGQRGLSVSRFVGSLINSFAAPKRVTAIPRTLAAQPRLRSLRAGIKRAPSDGKATRTTSRDFWCSYDLGRMPDIYETTTSCISHNTLGDTEQHDYASIILAFDEYVVSERPKIKSAADAATILRPLMMAATSNRQESVFAMYLDTGLKLIGAPLEIARGCIDGCLVHPRDILRPAILRNAAQIIVAHNHPSGSTEPSTEDVLLTKQLVGACSAAGIKLADHLVVVPKGPDRADNGYSSIRGLKLLKFD